MALPSRARVGPTHWTPTHGQATLSSLHRLPPTHTLASGGYERRLRRLVSGIIYSLMR